MATRPPALYRLSRLFRRLSLVALVLIIVYIGTAVYSATQLRPGDLSKGNSTTSVLSDGTVQVHGGVNLTNPGFYPINSITIAGGVHLPSGALLATASSPSVSVGPASTATIPFVVDFPVTFAGDESVLLTHDVQLPSHYWVNVTYASILTAALAFDSNITWGAPLFGFNATAGMPTTNPNGTVTIPVQVVFDNHSSFGVAGQLSFVIRDASAATCGSGSMPVSDPAGAHFDQTVDVVASASCNPHGGTLDGRFTGTPWSFGVPTEAIP